VTTISKSQFLTSVSIKDCTLRVPTKLLHYFFTSNNKSNLHFTDCHTNTTTAPLSTCHEAPVKISANSGWFEQEPCPFRATRLCTASFSFSFSIIISCSHFVRFIFGTILPLLGPETHSLQACLSPCPSSNRVPSLSIALEIRLFLLILRPLSSKLLFARLPHGNLGEPNTKHILRSLRIWCSVATTFSSALNAICLLLIFFYRNMTSVW